MLSPFHFFQHLIFTFLQISHPELSNELPSCFSRCCHVTIHVNRWETKTTVRVPSCHSKRNTGRTEKRSRETPSECPHTAHMTWVSGPTAEESHRASTQSGEPDARLGLGDSVQVSRRHRPNAPTANTYTSSLQ